MNQLHNLEEINSPNNGEMKACELSVRNLSRLIFLSMTTKSSTSDENDIIYSIPIAAKRNLAIVIPNTSRIGGRIRYLNWPGIFLGLAEMLQYKYSDTPLKHSIMHLNTMLKHRLNYNQNISCINLVKEDFLGKIKNPHFSNSPFIRSSYIFPNTKQIPSILSVTPSLISSFKNAALEASSSNFASRPAISSIYSPFPVPSQVSGVLLGSASTDCLVGIGIGRVEEIVSCKDEEVEEARGELEEERMSGNGRGNGEAAAICGLLSVGVQISRIIHHNALKHTKDIQFNSKNKKSLSSPVLDRYSKSSLFAFLTSGIAFIHSHTPALCYPFPITSFSPSFSDSSISLSSFSSPGMHLPSLTLSPSLFASSFLSSSLFGISQHPLSPLSSCAATISSGLIGCLWQLCMWDKQANPQAFKPVIEQQIAVDSVPSHSSPLFFSRLRSFLAAQSLDSIPPLLKYLVEWPSETIEDGRDGEKNQDKKKNMDGFRRTRGSLRLTKNALSGSSDNEKTDHSISDLTPPSVSTPADTILLPFRRRSSAIALSLCLSRCARVSCETLDDNNTFSYVEHPHAQRLINQIMPVLSTMHSGCSVDSKEAEEKRRQRVWNQLEDERKQHLIIRCKHHQFNLSPKSNHIHSSLAMKQKEDTICHKKIKHGTKKKGDRHRKHGKMVHGQSYASQVSNFVPPTSSSLWNPPLSSMSTTFTSSILPPHTPLDLGSNWGKHPKLVRKERDIVNGTKLRSKRRQRHSQYDSDITPAASSNVFLTKDQDPLVFHHSGSSSYKGVINEPDNMFSLSSPSPMSVLSSHVSPINKVIIPFRRRMKGKKEKDQCQSSGCAKKVTFKPSMCSSSIKMPSSHLQSSRESNAVPAFSLSINVHAHTPASQSQSLSQWSRSIIQDSYDAEESKKSSHHHSKHSKKQQKWMPTSHSCLCPMGVCGGRVHLGQKDIQRLPFYPKSSTYYRSSSRDSADLFSESPLFPDSGFDSLNSPSSNYSSSSMSTGGNFMSFMFPHPQPLAPHHSIAFSSKHMLSPHSSHSHVSPHSSAPAAALVGLCICIWRFQVNTQMQDIIMHHFVRDSIRYVRFIVGDELFHQDIIKSNVILRCEDNIVVQEIDEEFSPSYNGGIRMVIPIEMLNDDYSLELPSLLVDSEDSKGSSNIIGCKKPSKLSHLDSRFSLSICSKFSFENVHFPSFLFSGAAAGSTWILSQQYVTLRQSISFLSCPEIVFGGLICSCISIPSLSHLVTLLLARREEAATGKKVYSFSHTLSLAVASVTYVCVGIALGLSASLSQIHQDQRSADVFVHVSSVVHSICELMYRSAEEWMLGVVSVLDMMWSVNIEPLLSCVYEYIRVVINKLYTAGQKIDDEKRLCVLLFELLGRRRKAVNVHSLEERKKGEEEEEKDEAKRKPDKVHYERENDNGPWKRRRSGASTILPKCFTRDIGEELSSASPFHPSSPSIDVYIPRDIVSFTLATSISALSLLSPGSEDPKLLSRINLISFFLHTGLLHLPAGRSSESSLDQQNDEFESSFVPGALGFGYHSSLQLAKGILCSKRKWRMWGRNGLVLLMCSLCWHSLECSNFDMNNNSSIIKTLFALILFGDE
ncbi:hypothetical protein ADUPG1_008257 [Aduncisulcus paluster]|uniref:Uncharacterized protein n=1 Tax=Aduncisulcus paluster TaxID=2918883 RepID=A0ABQ5KRA1_9EUKA|nr:hypothetical protein ADUPG1_008257 [Aduncisulcus paluster]